jgi:hypothetical protein
MWDDAEFRNRANVEVIVLDDFFGHLAQVRVYSVYSWGGAFETVETEML